MEVLLAERHSHHHHLSEKVKVANRQPGHTAVADAAQNIEIVLRSGAEDADAENGKREAQHTDQRH